MNFNADGQAASRVLLTGGAGFVGHHVAEHLLKHTGWSLVVFDKLTYAGNLDRLRDISVFDDDRVLTLTCDFAQPIPEGIFREVRDVDFVLHLGAETHVDRSIEDAEPFVRSNVQGTLNMLELARRLPKLKMFFQFSTDEVFGPAGEFNPGFEVEDPHNPTNPYAATKSGAEMLVKAYRHCHRVPAVITRTMNVFGERQHPEKFIPLCIRKILAGETIPIHADKTRTRAGSRFYIHARNVADAYLALMRAVIGKSQVRPDTCAISAGPAPTIHSGQDFHIVGEREVDNLELAQLIGQILGKPVYFELVDFHSSRPGHDLRYALSGRAIREAVGWRPPKTFEQSLEKTVRWTVDHPHWLEVRR